MSSMESEGEEVAAPGGGGAGPAAGPPVLPPASSAERELHAAFTELRVQLRRIGELEQQLGSEAAAGLPPELSRTRAAFERARAPPRSAGRQCLHFPVPAARCS